jgi:hypothetical protein
VTDDSTATIVEGGLDDVLVRGTKLVCDDFDPPPRLAPNPVGDTLLLDRSGTSVRLTWAAPPADPAHDPPTLYRVWRSTLPSGGFATIASPLDPEYLDAGGLEAADPFYYLVSAENTGGTSGEAP